jgi:hypothetical protein
MLVVSNGFNIHDNSGFAYLGLGLLASLVWRFVWSRFKPRAAGT